MKHLSAPLLLLMALPLCASVALGEKEGHHDEGPRILTIDPETAERSGLTYETAGPGAIETSLTLNGKLQFDEDRVAHLTARFPGVVREAAKRLGDQVQRGDVLAVIESNNNLQRYQITAPFNGTIVKKHASIGEYVEEKADIFMLADVSELWADLYVFPQDFEKVGAGQKVTISVAERQISQNSTVSFISSIVDELTQAKFVRCVVKNGDGKLYPGQFVAGEIPIKGGSAPIVVKSSALQTLGKDTVVFTVDRATNEVKPTPVTTGRSGKEFTAIESGLPAGTTYFAGHTLILRAEAQKGELHHEH